MKKIWILLCLLLLVSCNQQNTVNSKVKKENENITVVEEKQEETVENENVTETTPFNHYKVNVDVLNVRQEPTTESDVLGQVFKDGVYEVLEKKIVNIDGKDEEWLNIKVLDTRGWIASWFCEETQEDLYDYNPRFEELDFKWSDYYVKGHQFQLQSDYFEIVYKLDDQKLLNNTLYNSGFLSIDFIDPLNRIYNMSGDILVKEEEEFYKAIYESMDVNAPILAFEHENNINYVNSEVFVSLVNNELEIWYKITYQEKEAYFKRNDFFYHNDYVQINKFHFLTDNGVIDMEADGGINSELAEHGLIIFKSSDSESIIIDMKTKEMYDYNKIRYDKEKNYLVSCYMYGSWFSDAKEQVNKFKVYALDDGLELLFEEERKSLGVYEVTFDDGITYKYLYEVENEWASTLASPYMETYHLDDNMNLTLISGNRDLVKGEQLVTVDVYDSMNVNHEPVDTISISSNELVFTKNIQVYQQELYNWYQVKDKNLYVLRKRTDLDGRLIRPDDSMNFIMQNGLVLTKETDQSISLSTYINDELLFRNILAFNRYEDGAFLDFYDTETTEEIMIPFEGEFALSPNKETMIVSENDYVSGFILKTVSVADLNVVFSIESDTGWISDMYWEDDQYFFKYAKYNGKIHETLVQVIYQDGQWQVLNLEDFDFIIN